MKPGTLTSTADSMKTIMSMGLLVLVGWLFSGGVPKARAHGELHELIRQATQVIQKNPKDPFLYLKRAELHRAHLGWDAAMADIEYAAALSNQWHLLHYARAGLYLDAQWYQSATVAAGRYLAHEPNHVATLIIRARALEKLGYHVAAAKDYTRAIDHSADPGPQLYLERAQALRNHGSTQLNQALRGLDQGLNKLGFMVTLHLAAIEIELELNRVDAALARIDSILARSPRKEHWLTRRGDILQRAGRNQEATEAFQSALEALNTLPPYRRRVPAMVQLEQRIQSTLAQLNGKDLGLPGG
jgi:tetratricopeptide (TPR) repeat protein